MPETTSPVPGRSGPRRVPSRFFHPLHNAVITVVMIVALAAALWRVVRWAVLDAVLLPAGPQECRIAAGACWAFVQDKAQLLLVGLYPREQLWRTGAAGLIAAVVVAMSCMPRFWRPALLPLWLGAAGACWLLLSGGVAGLPPVRSEEWGGLLLTIVLTAGSVLLAFPLGVLLALARRSDITALRLPAMAYVELMRAMPLLAVLFAAAVLVPVLLPADVEVPKVVRAWLGIAACMSAYVAEAVRGGLNA
ncbi:MAG: ABC transporter permease subunit, partial [Pseudomonadota bacterium]